MWRAGVFSDVEGETVVKTVFVKEVVGVVDIVVVVGSGVWFRLEFDIIEGVVCCGKFKFDICNLKLFRRFKISVVRSSNALAVTVSVVVFILLLLLVFEIMLESSSLGNKARSGLTLCATLELNIEFTVFWRWFRISTGR